MWLCVLFLYVFVIFFEGYSIFLWLGVFCEKIVNVLFEGYLEKVIYLWRGYEMYYLVNFFFF